MSEQTISVSITIDRPRQVVWEYFTTPENWKKWYPDDDLVDVTPGWQEGATLVFGSGPKPPILEYVPTELLRWGQGTFARLSDSSSSSTEFEWGTTIRGMMADDPLLLAEFQNAFTGEVTSMLEKLKTLLEITQSGIGREKTASKIKGIYLMTCSLSTLDKNKHSQLAGEALRYLTANNATFQRVHAQTKIDRPRLNESFQRIGSFGQPFDVLVSNFKIWIEQKGVKIDESRWDDYFFYREMPDPSEPLRKNYVLVYYHT
jgi:uncharacterized protein YndB with AHSA1/START domain